MDYSLLGPTGVKLSRICLGMATFSVAPDAQESDNCLSVKEERSAAYPWRAPAAHSPARHQPRAWPNRSKKWDPSTGGHGMKRVAQRVPPASHSTHITHAMRGA